MMTEFDVKRERQILWRLDTVFRRDLSVLIKKLEALIQNNVPKDEFRDLYYKVFHTLKVVSNVEREELRKEQVEKLILLQKEQKKQLYDLDLLERALRLLTAKSDVSQEKEIDDREREFLQSLKHELTILDRAA